MHTIAACLIFTAGSLAHEAIHINYLKDTLDKIQKVRLDSNEELDDIDTGSDFKEDETWKTVAEEIEISNDNLQSHAISLNFDETATVPNNAIIHTPSDDGVKEHKIKGYHYYYYPLNHYLEKYKGVTELPKDSDELSVMMETMMNTAMMQKPDNKVTPLFRAMSWFIGTSMVFILSILLMPKLKVKKAKEIIKYESWDATDINHLHFIMNTFVPHRSTIN